MTNVIEVDNLAGLNRIIDSTPKLVILFTAPSWCVPCQRLKPHYDAVAAMREDYVFVSVDVDTNFAISQACGIKSVPTVYEYQHGSYFKEVKGRTVVAIDKELS